ncbi:MAG TPA: hypothetical protein VND68_02935 [Chloroflexia bacterium]|nr:hypothetical protein [Chloroflexia bacterium]
MHSAEGHIKPHPPFDFDKSKEFLAGFAPTQRDNKPSAEGFTRALSAQGQVVAFQLTSTGSVEEPELHYRLLSEQPLDSALQHRVLDRIALCLSLHDDLGPFYRLGREDPLKGGVRGGLAVLFGSSELHLSCRPHVTRIHAARSHTKKRDVVAKPTSLARKGIPCEVVVSRLSYSR